MPYTLTHPGFMLPIKKWCGKYMSTTGLVFGSIAPDFDILLRLTNARFHLFQYTAKEILLLILPLAVVSGVYFHLVIRDILLKRLPGDIRSRLGSSNLAVYKTRPAQRFLRLAGSALAAILVHIFLDYISHWEAFPFKVYGWIYYNNYWAGIIYYYFALYAPVIIFSITGALLTLQYSGLIGQVPALWRQLSGHAPFLSLFRSWLITACFIAGGKIFISGLEAGYYLDHIVISMTNGMLVSFFATPTYYFLRERAASWQAGKQ